MLTKDTRQEKDHLPQAMLHNCPDCPHRCHTCNQDMALGDGCTVTAAKMGGLVFDRIRYGAEVGEWGASASYQRCHDCGVEAGGVHHDGCDMECCPFCGDQFISCDCGEAVRLVMSDDLDTRLGAHRLDLDAL